MLFNILTILPMLVCGLITMWLLMIQWRYRRRERSWLIAWGVAATMLYACHAEYFSRPDVANPYADTIYAVCNLAVYPLYLLYIITLVRGRCPRRGIIALLLGPAVIGGVVQGILYGMMDSAGAREFNLIFLRNDSMEPLHGVSRLLALWHVACRIIFAIEVVGVVFAGQYLIRHYDEDIAMNYADTEGRLLTSVRTILWILLGISVMSVVANIIGRHWFSDSTWLLMIPSLAFSLLLSLIGWEGIMYGLAPTSGETLATSESLALNADEAQLADGTVPTPVVAEHIRQTLREKKLFLRHDLRLSDLTEVMHTNRTYLWQALKESDTTFSDLINTLRIEYAAELIRKQPETSISNIYVLSGYSSRNSFYRNFHDIMHCTPREYAARYYLTITSPQPSPETSPQPSPQPSPRERE